MGRADRIPLQAARTRWHLEKVRIDSGGYDPGGAYWGVASPSDWATIYVAHAAPDYQIFVRAVSREAAKQLVRRAHPSAEFYR